MKRSRAVLATITLLSSACVAQEITWTPERVNAMLTSSNYIGSMLRDVVLVDQHHDIATSPGARLGLIADVRQHWISTNRNVDIQIEFLAFDTAEHLLAAINDSRRSSTVVTHQRPLTMQDIHYRNWFAEIAIAPLVAGVEMKDRDLRLTLSTAFERTFVTVFVSQAGTLKTPPYQGRVVYSATMVSTPQTTLRQGGPVAKVPISLLLNLYQSTPGFGPPKSMTLKKCYYYTFTDTNGAFHIPSLSVTYTNAVSPGSTIEILPQQFAILEPSGNVMIEKGVDSIFPFTIVHPSEPFEEILSDLRRFQAEPVHPQDAALFNAFCRKMRESANQSSGRTR